MPSAGSPWRAYVSPALRGRSCDWAMNQAIWSSGKSANAGTRSNANLSTMLYLAQILMNELHSHRSLANSGSDPFHGTMAYVSHSKKTGNVCLQQEGISVQSPSLRTFPFPDEIRTGQNEAAFVSLYYIRPPVSSRQRPRKH